ncbi:MAG: metal-dependent transcriptional regulator [Anaerovoracaceae bacterium]|nr:metal-dependent transcriptional regulator [Anaerovoracaceae bacterium]
MKILESAENYLETIHILSSEKGQVRAIDIVNYLGFSKPSVSIAMKQLESNGYILRDEDGYITLTDDGAEIATCVFERHRLLSDFFMALGVTEDVARSDACKVEHHISQETFDHLKENIDKLLSSLK